MRKDQKLKGVNFLSIVLLLFVLLLSVSVASLQAAGQKLPPPKPAQVSKTLVSSARKIKGKAENAGVKVTVSLNDDIINGSDGKPLTTSVDSSGNWTLTLPSSVRLKVADILQIFLSDKNGNTNPQVATKYQGTVFPAASKITVIDEPLIVTPQFAEVNLNESYNPKTNISATNSDGDKINFGTQENDLKYTTNINLRKVGVYSTTYTMKDALNPELVTRKKILVIVKDAKTVVDFRHGYVIAAKNYQLYQTKDFVLGTNEEIINKAGVKAWQLSDGTTVDVIVKDSGGYINEVGGYQVNVAVKKQPEVINNLIASIIGPKTVVKDNYALNVNDYFIEKNKVTGGADFTNKNYGSALAWNFQDDTQPLHVGVVINSGYQVKAAQGTYDATLKINEIPNIQSKVEATIVDRDVVKEGMDQIVGANNVVVGTKKAQTIATNHDLINLTNALAWKKDNARSNENIFVESSNFVAASGQYNVTFALENDSSVKINSTITVEEDEYADSGQKYLVEANDFNINAELVNNVSDAEIIKLARAQVKSLDSSHPSGTLSVVSTAIQEIEGSYDIVFLVNEEKDVNIKVKANVTAGGIPILTVTSPIEIAVNGSFDAKAGISAIDAEDGDLSSKIVQSGQYNVERAGLYVLTYTITDSDYNKVEKSRVLIVNDRRYEVGNKYLVQAHDFIINKADVQNKEDDINQQAHAKTFQTNNGTTSKTSLVDKGGYKAEVGEYTLTFAASAELGTAKSSRVTVVDKNEISVGRDFSLGANDITIGRAEAENLSDDQLLQLSQAEGWRNNSYQSKLKPLVEDKTALQSQVGAYSVILKLKEGVEITIQVNVIDKDVVATGADYSVGANDIIVGKEQAMALTKQDNLRNMSQVSAWKNDDTTKTSATILLSSDFEAIPGLQQVAFVSKDEPTTKVETEIRILDRDHVSSSNQYVIAANNINLEGNSAQTINSEEIIKKAQAQVFQKATLKQKGTIKVVENTVKELIGQYHIDLYVVEEPSLKTRIQVNVNDGRAPILNVTNSHEIKVGETFNPLVGVSALDAFNGDISQKISYQGSYDIKQAGVYPLTYTVTDRNNNTTKVTRLLVVNDGRYVVGKKYVIGTSDFIVNQKEVNLSDKEIIEQAQGQGFALEDGSEVALVILNKERYINQTGVYNIKFGLKDAVNVTHTSKEHVIDKEEVAVGNKYSIGANNITIGQKDADGLSASKLLQLSNSETWLGDNYSIKGKVVCENSEVVQTTPGTYLVNIHSSEEVGTKIVIKVSVTTNDHVATNTQYSIGANDVYIGKDKAQNLVNDKDLIALTKANAWHKNDSNKKSEVVIVSTTLVRAPGIYYITYQVLNKPLTKLTTKVTILDKDEVGTGSTSVIGANNFNIDTLTASSLTNKAIINKAKAQTYAINNGNIIVLTNSIQGAKGVYKVELSTKEDPSAKVQINVNVTIGDAPQLAVTNPVEIEVGNNFEPMSGVSARDTEDGDLTSKITFTGSFDIAKAGVYILTYNIVDSDYNKESKTRVIIVNDGSYEVGSDNIVHAQDFSTKVNEFTTDEETLLKRAQVTTFRVSDGAQQESSIKELDGYKAQEGVYNLSFGPKKQNNPIKVCKASVINNDVIQRGENYTLAANNLVIGTKQAENIQKNDLISLMKARAFANNDLTNLGTINVTSISLEPVPGLYEVIFNVKKEPKTTLKATVKVIATDYVANGSKYLLSANDFTWTTTQAKALTIEKLIASAKARIIEKSSAKPSGTMVVESHNIKSQEGEYTIGFASGEDASLKTKIKVRITKKDNVLNTSKYSMHANNIVISMAEAQTLNEDELVKKTLVQAKLRTDAKQSGAVGVVQNSVKAQMGTYPVTFGVKEQPNSQIKVNVRVVNYAIVSDPMINVVSKGSKQISGTGLVGSKIVVSLPDNQVVRTEVVDNGRWQVQLPSNNSLVPNNKIDAYATLNNKYSNASEVIISSFSASSLRYLQIINLTTIVFVLALLLHRRVNRRNGYSYVLLSEM